MPINYEHHYYYYLIPLVVPSLILVKTRYINIAHISPDFCSLQHDAHFRDP